MHPEVQLEQKGICSKCGMRLVAEKKKQASYTDHQEHKTLEKHKGHSPEMFLYRFIVVAILTVPIILYSELAELVLRWEAPQFPGVDYVILLLGSIIFFYGGGVFILGAYRELRAKLPGMMTLISMAISAAYLFSVYTIFAKVTGLFWELATLIAVMLLGHWLEMKAVRGAQGALQELAKLLPDTAEVLSGKKIVTISLNKLQEDDLVLVKPGAKIPADGIVAEGYSEVNESIVTGESKLIKKKKGDEVIAGTINIDGSLTVKVTKIGEKTFLAGVMRLVAEAQASKSRLQILSDKAAFLLTIIAVLTGGMTLLTWLLLGKGTAFALTRLVAVLVIACPHALGLAVPLVASISTRMAANNGFLVKQRLALEAARTIDTVLFDKTGTLTKGEFGIDTIVTTQKWKESEVLLLAASVNKHSEHSIAKAIVQDAEKKNITLKKVTGFKRIPGKGVQATIGKAVIKIGSETLLKDIIIRPAEAFTRKVHMLSAQGKTVVYVISGKNLAGAVALADVIREESREAVKLLQECGIKVAMVTGDSEDVASWVAKELSMDEYFARVLPEKKSEKVQILQQKGRKVAMVGDGVNDAPALMQADLGIAIGAGTNVAIESAGIILVRNDPRDIPKIIHLSQMTYSKMIQNLFWATGYNIIALPLAAGVLTSKGIILQPALAAVFMSASTVIVAVNALLLRKKKM
ncbi:heavy metal translocating P-type ATPase [Candidatus Woesearchaeota archaeon]|nr:heavy metal translocating P-type ATPase [Candidatus Woesearchaeota archaeon]